MTTFAWILLGAVILFAAVFVAAVVTVAYLDDSDWPLGPKDGAR